MTDPSLPCLILDGGLGTHLADRGNDVTGSLWSAQILRDDPSEIVAAHRDFFAAGADVATTCSYEVTVGGLLHAGVPTAEVEDVAESLLRQSVQLAVHAADGDHVIAASVGPYGAGPGQGTEYDGAYGLTAAQLAAWHRRRIGILADTGADLLFAETVPSVLEVEALAGELDRAGRPAVLSVTVTPGDGRMLSDGTDLQEVAAIVSGSTSIRAVGVNCGSVADVLAGVRRLAEFTDLPLAAYPNSGERWDHVNRVWVPRETGGLGLIDAVPDFLEAGVHLLGGCCRVTPREITAIRERIADA
ncbi:homocysteine S-methyltransferase [Corynebacterium kalidii]|uniref:Homocysteine S-methyltransferase n=1 Tax=Corynebacterium kalidii TaxID=2931982 RepID=A0A9X1WJ04_9CORY|nr:homocysteine S-methyltransferase [Corynebacterium kalidii]MCJ7858457.1 homocysteine S-methyltransferase [Corynebacterium kalidii]